MKCRLPTAAVLLFFSLTVSPGLALDRGSDFALVFDGIDDRAVSNANFDVTQLTFEAWIKYQQGVDEFGGVAAWGQEATASWEVSVRPSDERVIGLQINWDKPDERALVGNSLLPFHDWVHVALTYDGSVARIFLNGDLDTSATWDVPLSPGGPNAMFALGVNFPGGDEYGASTLDEVRVWNVARDRTEIISTMCETLIGNEPGLLAYYDFNEGAGDTLHDRTGSGRDAVIEGAPAWVVADYRCPSTSSGLGQALPALATVQVLPNPVLGRATVRVVPSSSGKHSLQILDASGRLVRALPASVLERGRAHDWQWDGRAADGRRVAAGVYFLALGRGSAGQVGKIVVIR